MREISITMTAKVPDSAAMLLRLAVLLIPVLVIGCSRVGATADAAVDPASAKRAARVQRAQELAAQPPKVTRHRMESGELQVIEVPTVGAGGFADSQRCFLWRDSEYRTATMQCPADSGAPALEGPAPEARYRP